LPDALWRGPYLPIDPKGLGRTYDSIVRVNSQSGKGGIAYLLQRDHGIVLPRRMQIEFSAIVQAMADGSEAELSGQQIWDLFQSTYMQPHQTAASMHYLGHRLFDDAQGQGIELQWLDAQGQPQTRMGTGNGPIAATVAALNLPVRIDSYEERSVGTGAEASAVAIVEASFPGVPGSRFGAGKDANIVKASVLAVFNAAMRCGHGAG
jgi:2-isopropylmalate synthase